MLPSESARNFSVFSVREFSIREEKEEVPAWNPYKFIRMQTLVAEMYQYFRTKIFKRDNIEVNVNGFSLYAYKMYYKIWELRIFFGEFQVEIFFLYKDKEIFFQQTLNVLYCSLIYT